MASLAQLLLQLPYFGLTIFFFFWSPPLASIIYRIRFASSGPRKDIYEWWVQHRLKPATYLCRLSGH